MVSPDDELLQPAFDLARFLWPNIDEALDIVGKSFTQLAATFVVQGKREAYIPGGGRRTRVLLGRPQLVQFQVMRVSDEYELNEERARCPGIGAFTIRFVKHISYRALAQNSFYACVAVMRVLSSFKTGQALDVYALVAEDRPKDESESRRVRAWLIESLEARFGHLLAWNVASGVETRFAARPTTPDDVATVLQCLTIFTPWSTPHVASDGTVSALGRARGAAFDDSATELGRIHVFMDNLCLRKVLASAGIREHFEDKVLIPRLHCSDDQINNDPVNNEDMSVRTGQRRLNPKDTERIAQASSSQHLARRIAAEGPLKIRLDGRKTVEYQGGSVTSFQVKVPAGTGVIELIGTVGSRDVILGTYIVSDAEEDGILPLEIELPLPPELAGSVITWVRALDAALGRRKELGREWQERARRWKDWFYDYAPGIVPSFPRVGFASELRTTYSVPAVHEIMLSPREPENSLSFNGTANIRAGVSDWPADQHAPAMFLISDDGSYSEVATAKMDDVAGVPSALFESVPEGSYTIWLEPLIQPAR